MRKWLLTIAALLFSANAQAHVSAVPFPEVGSLYDAHKAAFSIVQTYLPPALPQIFYNIVTDAGAACNGDVLTVTRTASITSGTTALSIATSAFTGADVGKAITIPGAGDSGGTYFGTISAVGPVTNPQSVTLNNNASTTLSSVSTGITYGTDDSAKFVTFNTWARANQGSSNQVVLTIPNGKSCWFGNANSVSGTTLLNAWAAGINNLIVEGTGATINSVNGFGFQLGGAGIIQKGLTDANGKSARIQTVSAGSSTVTLTAASFGAGYISRFSVGGWIMIGGVDPQGLWDAAFGFPPNNRFFEWRQITATCNNTGPCSGTATVTLDRPLTNSYLSTWPNWNSGNAFEVDQGGPATIFAISDTWNTTVEYRGLTINQTSQVYAQGRNITYRNVTFGGVLGGIPTQNENWTAINTTWGPGTVLETDKLVGTMTMDGVSVPRIDFQSSSTDLFVLKNSAVPIIFGTPTNTDISDTTIGDFRPGAIAYGQSTGYTKCTRCIITSFAPNGFLLNRPTDFFMSSGVVRFPNTAANSFNPSEAPFIPPNGNVFWTASGFYTIGLFNVQAMTQDPWPALDNQTATTNVTIGSGSKSLGVSTSIFASGDVGKVIYIPAARATSGAPVTLETYITAFTNSQSVTINDAATSALAASSQQLQWGTSNTYIQTNEAGGLPGIVGVPQFRTHPAPRWTCDTCSGDATVVATSVQRGATPGAPLGQYSSRDYAPTSAQGNLGSMLANGKIVSLSINVTQAYSGAGAAVLHTTSQFDNMGTIKQSNWTTFSWGPQINLKQAGLRVITPAGVTCDTGGGPVGGACSGDTMGTALPEAVWIQQQLDPYMGSTLSAGIQPQFTMTIQTNQGVVP